jgi:hypothetical protein
MKLLTSLLALATVLAVACSGDDDGGENGAPTGGGSNNASIAAEDADRVAHAGLPTVADLPPGNWQVVAQDNFSSGENSFVNFIEGNPECAQLAELATLESVLGGEDEDAPPIGHGQVELEDQNPDVLLPTSFEVEIEIDESAAGSRAQFAIVRDLVESDETANCLISVLNTQFAETGPSGVQLEVTRGTASAPAPEDGARMAFDMHMTIANIELDMAMEMYFWPYENASVRALFLGTNEVLNAELVGGVLQTVDRKLKAAAGE